MSLSKQYSPLRSLCCLCQHQLHATGVSCSVDSFLSILQVAHGDLTLYVIASNETEQQEWISLLRQCELNTCLLVCLLVCFCLDL